MSFIYSLTDTWNNGSTTFTAIKMDVTDTASAAASELIALQVGGTDKFTVRKDGLGYFASNLGIGTTSPTSPLDIEASTATVDINMTNTANRAEINLQESGSTKGIIQYRGSTNGTLPSTMRIGTQGADDLIFNTAGAERLRVLGTGNVGIGTTSPGTPLEIQEDASGDAATIRLRNADGSATGNTIQGTRSIILSADYDNDGAASSSLIGFDTDGSRKMTLDSSGFLGIGTDSPATLTAGITALSISDQGGKTTGDKIGELNFVTNDGSFTGTFSDGIGAAINAVSTSATGAAYALTFTTATITGSSRAERCRILHSGGFLIGKTADNTTDDGHVLGDAGYLYTTRNGNICHVLNRKGTEGDIVQYRNDNVTVGSVSIAASSTSYNTSSDARLKHDIVDAPEASDLIDGIQVRSFKWNIDDSEQRYGMVAQELVEVAPEAVTGEPDSDEMMAVDYSKLVPMLVKEVQSLRKRVAELEGK